MICLNSFRNLNEDPEVLNNFFRQQEKKIKLNFENNTNTNIEYIFSKINGTPLLIPKPKPKSSPKVGT